MVQFLLPAMARDHSPKLGSTHAPCVGPCGGYAHNSVLRVQVPSRVESDSWTAGQSAKVLHCLGKKERSWGESSPLSSALVFVE